MELKLPEQIDVIDITMRDGLQNEEHYVPLEAKLYLADRLIKAGFKRLEVGSISHVAYVPQFKDVDELLLKLPKDVDVEYTVLALTPKAIERVGGLLDRGAKIDRVLTGQIATSEAYAMKNMRRTHQQLFDEAEKNVKALHDMGIKRVAGNIGTVFGCPIQGKVSIERAYEFVDRMFDIGFDEVEHSDSDGIATPRDIADYFQVILEKHQTPHGTPSISMIFAAWASPGTTQPCWLVSAPLTAPWAASAARWQTFWMVCRLRARGITTLTPAAPAWYPPKTLSLWSMAWVSIPAWIRRGSTLSAAIWKRCWAVRFTPLPARCVPVWEHNRSHRRRSFGLYGAGLETEVLSAGTPGAYMARLPVGVRCSKQLGIDFEHTSLVQGDEAVVHQAALASDDAMGKVPEVLPGDAILVEGPFWKKLVEQLF